MKEYVVHYIHGNNFLETCFHYKDRTLADIKIMISEDFKELSTLNKVTVWEIKSDSPCMRQVFYVEREEK